jgi:hypothetical protein
VENNNKSESFPGYLPKLKLEYFEFQVVPYQGYCYSGFSNVLLLGIFPSKKIKDRSVF